MRKSPELIFESITVVHITPAPDTTINRPMGHLTSACASVPRASFQGENPVSAGRMEVSSVVNFRPECIGFLFLVITSKLECDQSSRSGSVLHIYLAHSALNFLLFIRLSLSLPSQYLRELAFGETYTSRESDSTFSACILHYSPCFLWPSFP
jgi:hypothetical protein